ncbi:MAG TPA: SsrA-binding protein SmpB [Bacteroidota bacterium]|nr:SsrA-binding protein SmpB [Bacteroidota bacterium]
MPTPNEAVKSILINRRARHEYHVLDTLEVGIVLRGTEVKSIRAGKVNLQDSYAAIDKGELYLHNMHISPFEKGNIFNHDPVRVRKLLARRKEILKLAQKTNEKGLTLIPLQVYFLGRHVKIELGICKGKKLYDKRESLKTRDIQREMERDR